MFTEKVVPALIFLAATLQVAAVPVAEWKMNEAKGQILKNSINGKESGWLGASAHEDKGDPCRLKEAKQNVLCFEGGKFATLPDGKYSDFAKAKGFAIQLWFKPWIKPSRQSPRIQLLSKGYDSARNSWQLVMIYIKREKKCILSFIFKDSKKKYSRVDAFVSDIADRWNRVTVTGNNEKLKLYLNGKLLAEKLCDKLPEKNRYPLIVGAYSSVNKFGFSGNIKDLKIYKSAITPEPLAGVKPGKLLLDSDFSAPDAVNAWRPVNGKWFLNKKMYCEFSDKETPGGAWSVAGKPGWKNYCLNTTVKYIDNQGSLLLGAGWRDINNHYELAHKSHGTGMRSLSIIRVKDGRKTTLAEIDSSAKDLPLSGKGAVLNYKIYFYNGIIAVMINGKFYLSVEDKSFTSGKVAVGTQARKIGIKRLSVRTLNDFINPIIPVRISPVAVAVSHSDFRHAFYRGEKINLTVSLRNNTQEKLLSPVVKFTVNGGINECRTVKLGSVAPGARVEGACSFSTGSWKSGEYKLNAALEGTPYRRDYNIFIAPEKRKDTYRYYSWGGGVNAPFFKSLQDHGFNGTTLVTPPRTDYRKQKMFIAQALDQALRHGQHIKIDYNCLWSRAPKADTRVIRYDGSKGRAPGPWNPAQRKWALEKIRDITAMLNRHPVVTDFLLNSESENVAEPDYSAKGRARAKKELGFEAPVPQNQKKEKDGTAGRMLSVPKAVKAKTPAVFPDDNKWYKFFKWFWQRGCGDNYLNEDIKNIIKKTFPDAKVTHDPFRDVPLFYRNKGLDQVATWFYNQPDASETLATAEVLVNAAHDEKIPKGLRFGASLFLYDKVFCPAKQRWAGVQPTDIIVESDWLAFSRVPEVIEHYSIAHLMPSNKPQYRQKNTYDKLAQFSKEVLQPLWPTVSRLNRAPRECAMLLSFSSQLFGPRIWSGYGYSSGFGYYAALQMAHIPTDIIFDENIQRGDLSKYKILFMHQTTHLPQSVFNKITAFAKNGGTVVCGEPFAKLIPGAVKFDMDMKKRHNSSYYAIKSKGGLTADIVYLDMEKKAAAISSLLKNKLTPYADCNSFRAFLNVLEKNGAKYIFVVNDKRTFGDYVGKKYRAVMEQGLPQTVDVALRTKNAAVYDMVTHQKLKSSYKNGMTSVKINLKPAWGAVLAVYPQDIAKVEIVTPQKIKAGEETEFTVRVIGTDGKAVQGVQPVEMVVTDSKGNRNEFSGYYAAVNGISKIKFIPAKNDSRGKWTVSVTELSSGMKASKSFIY